MSLFAGIGAVGSAVIGGAMEGDRQEAANEFNAEEAQKNRDWQDKNITSARDYNTQMANTTHQREVADLRAAGINPMLTAMGGNGAPAPTSPTGSGGQASAAGAATGLGRGVGAAFSSAMQAIKTKADVANVEKDTLYKEAGALSAAAQAQQSTATAKQLDEVTHQLSRGRDAAAAEADARKNKAGLDQTYQATERLMGVIKQGSGIANDATSAVSNLMPSKLLQKTLNKAWQKGSKAGYGLGKYGEIP